MTAPTNEMAGKWADYFADAPDTHAAVAINVPKQRAEIVACLRLAASPSAMKEALEAIISVIDNLLGDTDPSIPDDYDDDDIKREYPLFWVCQQLSALALDAPAKEAAAPAAETPTDSALCKAWCDAGGGFYGPSRNGVMSEAKLLPFLRSLSAPPLQAPADSDAVRDAVERAAECFKTAKELRDNSRGNCNAIEQALMWERKAVNAIRAALTAPAAKAPAVSEADVGREDRRAQRIQELHEIADGATGEGLYRRGLARQELNRMLAEDAIQSAAQGDGTDAPAADREAVARALPRWLYATADEFEPDEFDKLSEENKKAFRYAADAAILALHASTSAAERK